MKAIAVLIFFSALLGFATDRAWPINAWRLSGPFTEDSGILFCEAISPEGLGLRMRADDTYLMAFFDLQITDHPFIKDILGARELQTSISLTALNACESSQTRSSAPDFWLCALGARLFCKPYHITFFPGLLPLSTGNARIGM